MISIAFEKAQSHCHVEKGQEVGKTREDKPIRRPCDNPDERGWWFAPTLLQSGQREVSRFQRYACGGLTMGGGEPDGCDILGGAHRRRMRSEE